jgi:hypothetical protein
MKSKLFFAAAIVAVGLSLTGCNSMKPQNITADTLIGQEIMANWRGFHNEKMQANWLEPGYNDIQDH